MVIKGIFNRKEESDDSFLYDRKNIEDIIKEIESKTKVMEIDFERRLIYLEKEIQIIRAILGKIKDEKSLKMLLENSQEIKEKLRSLEDLKYVEHLEVVDLSDKINLLNEEFNELKKKYNILIESLEKIPELNTFALEFKDKYKDLESRISKIEMLVYSIGDKYAKNEDVVKLRDQYEKINAEIEKALKDIKKISHAFKENLSINEKFSKLVKEKYDELREKIEKYDGYEDEISLIKQKLDNIAKRIGENKKEEIDKVYYRIEYALRRYEKALNLLQYEIEFLRSSKEKATSEHIERISKDISEIKNLKESLEKIIEETKNISPKKIKDLAKVLNNKSKKIIEYEKEVNEIKEKILSLEKKIEGIDENLEALKEETKEEIEKYNYEMNIKMLNLSKNTAKIMDSKITKIKRELSKKIKEEIRHEISKALSETLIETLKNEIWEETLSMITSHEITENQKIEMLKEFEKYIAEKVDKLREEMLTKIREEIFALKDVEESKEIDVMLNMELLDLKKKIYHLINEQKQKIAELEKKLEHLEKERAISGHPYIIE